MSAPNNHVLCRLAAANAGISEVILNKGNATGFYAAGGILKLILTFGLATPHCLNVAFFVSGGIKEFLIGASLIGAVGSVFECAVVELLVNLLQSLFNLFLEVVKGNKGLFTGYAANKHAGVVFDVTGANFKAERNALHLILRILPTGGVVAVVELYAQGLGELCLNFGSLFKHALLVLSNWNDNKEISTILLNTNKR